MNDIVPTASVPQADGLQKKAEFLEFVEWMATPEPLRVIRTQTDLAAKLGVSIDTLVDWKKRDGFWALVQERVQGWGKERTPNVIARFYQKLLRAETVTCEHCGQAMKVQIPTASAADFKLWFEYIQGWAEKAELKHSGGVVIAKDDESREMLQVLMEKDDDGKTYWQKFIDKYNQAKGKRESIRPNATPVDVPRVGAGASPDGKESSS